MAVAEDAALAPAPGLPRGVTLYCLRHRYGLMGIKNGVNLKLLSLCMGHARTQMTEHYIAEAGLTQQVQQAAWQVAYGLTSSGEAFLDPVRRHPPIEVNVASREFLQALEPSCGRIYW